MAIGGLGVAVQTDGAQGRGADRYGCLEPGEKGARETVAGKLNWRAGQLDRVVGAFLAGEARAQQIADETPPGTGAKCQRLAKGASISAPPRTAMPWTGPRSAPTLSVRDESAVFQSFNEVFSVSIRLSPAPGKSGSTLAIPRSASARRMVTTKARVRLASSNSGIIAITTGPVAGPRRNIASRPPGQS